jgi:hypothetical protein
MNRAKILLVLIFKKKYGLKGFLEREHTVRKCTIKCSLLYYTNKQKSKTTNI